PRTGTPNAPSAAGTKATAGPTPALGLAVLVVDDNAVNREVAVAMLEESHCRVSLAHDGQAAVLAARERRFDVMLMDCQMPGMDGFAATAAIRRNEAERGMPPTPIIALTANVLTRDRARCIAAGMNGFLSKPFSAAQLTKALLPIAEARGTLRAAEAAEATIEPEVDAATTETVPVDTTEAESEMFDPAVTDMLAAPLFEPAPQSSPSVLDVEQIKAIRSLGKPHVLERLCELLFESGTATIQSIERGLAAGDLAAVATAAHSLKSAASNLGGRRLAEQLDRCESMARDGADIAAVRTAAVGLRQSYAAFEGALRELTGRRTGT
ncbi:MAG TPA: response regulator, partial [Steroidobacteraceae bacterium]|nr:response regulator [Steroidobacteraceae bacterium]